MKSLIGWNAEQIMTRETSYRALIAMAVVMIAACGGKEQSSGVVIDNAWARATPPGARVGAAYMRIESIGELDRVTAVSTSAARSAEIHATVVAAGQSSMRPVGDLVLEPDEPVTLEPGGMHVMLMDLVQPLVAGQSFMLTLHLEKRGDVTVKVIVRSPES